MQPANTQYDKVALRYLALGDSYTIGEGVTANESFPYQLAAKLQTDSVSMVTPQIIARTGWTTSELQAAVNKENLSKNFNLVTLLIGVNDQYRNASVDQYRFEFRKILQQAIIFAGGNRTKVIVLSIPDWSVTPFAKNSDRSVTAISEEIDAFNAVNKEETVALGVSYVDITTASRKAASDRSLIAADGLHPSGKMYTEWVELITKQMKNAGR
ncbi:SGNH/GDSL hydrolase family protein [Niabella sp. 22666]|uniref:SGNH/GDSL hydrolase family protein n=1 Tax=Niabella sp. 22666 TaxID=3453954 RepID=UPI003F85AF3A